MTGELLSKEAREKTRQLVRGEAKKAGFYRNSLLRMFDCMELYKGRASEASSYKEQAERSDQKSQEIMMLWSKMSIARY